MRYATDKQNFNFKKFAIDHIGMGRGKMFRDVKDMQWYYGLGPLNCDQRDLEDGFVTRPLYEGLCRTFGRDAMEEYFQPEGASSEKSKKQAVPNFDKKAYGHAEIDALADTMVTGRMAK